MITGGAVIASESAPSVALQQCCILKVRLHFAADYTTGWTKRFEYSYNGKDSPYSIAERGVPELIPVLGSQPVGDVSRKPVGRLPLLSARPAVTPATFKRAATNFAAW